MEAFLHLLVIVLLVGTQANGSFKEGDGILIDSEHIPNNQILQLVKDVDCKNGDKKPNTESCSYYYECINNKYEDVHCFWPRKFDSASLRCVFWGAKCAEPEPTAPPATETSPPDPVTNPPGTETNPPDPVTNPPDPVTNPPDPVTNPPDPVTNPPDPATNPPDPATNPPDPATNPPDPVTNPPDSGKNDGTPTHHLPSYFIIALSIYFVNNFFSVFNA